ncbi:DNA methylase [Verminephrobacter aporrectodeae subsp. tuberculatae]|uniref:DNA methyltransferase n=1 Tax=Verminephrobacter aporrectodeae TaxID=1110389 RepID=UPI0004980203|nr:DNA methyltransferase [Verminephrobacter aporrectodeae]MCW8196873.1 DNA methylase [Verminephrobacter aporrectodeae subsp. tuberculatae]
MRHRFHAICPYFAMFPEAFVEKHLAASHFDGVVFDPFCGRGTTVFQALLDGRKAAGCDLHPVAVCITSAKCNPPDRNKVLARINALQALMTKKPPPAPGGDMAEFFSVCFHVDTYDALRFLRKNLDWRNNGTDGFIAALCLGALHGESHRSPNYFSNRMPRTISTKPAYSVRWWHKHGYVAPQRDVFDILRNMTDFRFRTPAPDGRGEIVESDARKAKTVFPHLQGKVTDIITSPPYLDTTNYQEDQWLRLWFLGEDAKSSYARGDGRHYNKVLYWHFLKEAWEGVAPLLAPQARIVVRIGGRKLSKDEIFSNLLESLTGATGRKVEPTDDGVTSAVRKTQANSFRGAKASSSVEHDFCFIVS